MGEAGFALARLYPLRERKEITIATNKILPLRERKRKEVGLTDHSKVSKNTGGSCSRTISDWAKHRDIRRVRPTQKSILRRLRCRCSSGNPVQNVLYFSLEYYGIEVR